MKKLNDFIEKRPEFSMGVTIISIFVFLGVCFSYFVNSAIEREKLLQQSIYDKKTIWYIDHKCFHEGYISGRYNPIKTYRCGSQLLIWADIPTE
jgi:hypothetical protein